MKINITRLLTDQTFDPYFFCDSPNRSGLDDIAFITFDRAKKARQFHFLRTKPQIHAFQVWALDTGAWDADDVASWTKDEINALFLQELAGQMQDSNLGPCPDKAEWTAYQENLDCNHQFERYGGRYYFHIV